MSSPDISMPGSYDDTPSDPQPRLVEPIETVQQEADRFFMFHHFDEDPLFNCPHGTDGGRNLALCIDDTANQSNSYSSSIVEIYSRLVELAGVQLTFYNSGIGIHEKPSFKSWKYYKQVFDHTVNTEIAQNFERTIYAAYEWLSETYEPGDRIFMFGFSRGAYQVRIIAGMINKVGLLHKGSEHQIPFVYELYASVLSKFKRDRNTESKNAENKKGDKDIFCFHKDVKVHFVGAWDTVSSIGLRGEPLPETVSGMRHVCSFRHALALDERRVEYANSGLAPRMDDTRSNVKEVWFSGTHSDIGGGNIATPNLPNFSPSLRWMMQEAMKRGLHLKPTMKHWEPLPLAKSLEWFWRPLEILPTQAWSPIQALSYRNRVSSTSRPHLYTSRQIQRRQRIHHTVFTHHQISDSRYCPRATPPSGSNNWGSFFETCEFSPDNPILEFDPFENAAVFLSSLEEACTTISNSNDVSSATVTQYTHSMLALHSFLEAHASRQTSINELHNIGMVLLSALDVSLRYQNATTRINAPNLKQALIRLLAAVNLTQTTDGHWFKPSNVRRWAGPIPAKYKPALFSAVNHFACISQHELGEYTPKVAFSGLDSTQIIFTSSGVENTAVLIWDGSIRPPKTIVTVPGERSTMSCDGSHIVVGDRQNVSIIDATTKPPLVIKGTDDEHLQGIRSLCLCNNHQTLATGNMSGHIKLWQREGDRWNVFKRFRAFHDEIYCLAFSRDDSKLGILVLFKCIKVWSLETGTLIKLEASRNVLSLAWSPSRDRIVSGTTDGIVKIWSADRRQIEHTFKAHHHDDWIWCLTFRDDGQVLATGSDYHRIRVWRCDTWENTWEFDTDGRVVSIAFSPDGKRLVSSSTGMLHLWDVDMVETKLETTD